MDELDRVEAALDKALKKCFEQEISLEQIREDLDAAKLAFRLHREAVAIPPGAIPIAPRPNAPVS